VGLVGVIRVAGVEQGLFPVIFELMNLNQKGTKPINGDF
jgi:hypothetical protein